MAAALHDHLLHLEEGRQIFPDVDWAGKLTTKIPQAQIDEGSFIQHGENEFGKDLGNEAHFWESLREANLSSLWRPQKYI